MRARVRRAHEQHATTHPSASRNVPQPSPWLSHFLEDHNTALQVPLPPVPRCRAGWRRFRPAPAWGWDPPRAHPRRRCWGHRGEVESPSPASRCGCDSRALPADQSLDREPLPPALRTGGVPLPYPAPCPPPAPLPTIALSPPAAHPSPIPTLLLRLQRGLPASQPILLSSSGVFTSSPGRRNVFPHPNPSRPSVRGSLQARSPLRNPPGTPGTPSPPGMPFPSAGRSSTLYSPPACCCSSESGDRL